MLRACWCTAGAHIPSLMGSFPMPATKFAGVVFNGSTLVFQTRRGGSTPSTRTKHVGGCIDLSSGINR